MIAVGTAREIITPPRGVPLVGYFNPRPNCGVLDQLHVRTVLFAQDGVIGGVVSYDLCFVTSELVNDVRRQLRQDGLGCGDHLIFTATHTHTGPAVADLFTTRRDPAYYRQLVAKTAMCVGHAHANLAPARLAATSFADNPFAFNRRYVMTTGQVATNPGKLNPDIVRPEGPVDREIGVLAAIRGKRYEALLVNIVNHSDTVGGDLVSADWPGHFARAIQQRLGDDTEVVTLIGCAGNINHFDVATRRRQTSPAEARRIGIGYAKLVLAHLPGLQPVATRPFLVDSRELKIPGRAIPADAVTAARRTLATASRQHTGKDLTSEGLSGGDMAVQQFFAGQLLAFAEQCAGQSRTFELTALKFGTDLAMISLPGEPFTEIGMAIKRDAPFRHTLVISHAQGKAGYIPLPECFQRGGYETLPVVSGGCREDTAPRLLAAAQAIWRRKRKTSST